MVLYISPASTASETIRLLKRARNKQGHKCLEHRAKLSVLPAVLVIICGSPFLFTLGAASSDDTPTCSFAGSVKLNGADVADGTTILVTIEGDESSTTTPTAYGTSTYFMPI